MNAHECEKIFYVCIFDKNADGTLKNKYRNSYLGSTNILYANVRMSAETWTKNVSQTNCIISHSEWPIQNSPF